ncbi:hypothetical protein DL96DRAFT_1523381 [Flagelloscypha sp. PMI_526]|nr:hypothetical protein DL96DRAFT_1523381 [Flagelloscypha sp. PMI_526]
MAHLLQMETPSRILRRIEAVEDTSMPSLPSIPHFGDDDEDEEDPSNMSNPQTRPDQVSLNSTFDNLSEVSAPITSTPVPSSHGTRLSAGTSLSTQKFATSLARSSASRASYGATSRAPSISRLSHPDSFEIGPIPSLPSIQPGASRYTVHDEDSSGGDPAADEENSLPDQYLPPELDQDEEDYERSLEDALEPLSQPPSPSYKDYSQDESTPKKDYYDYSMSLRSEPRAPLHRKGTPRKHRPSPGRRTPSLTRSIGSTPSSPSNSTPQSVKSIPLPRSATASPSLLLESLPPSRSATNSPANFRGRALLRETPDVSGPADTTRSMDITDVHVSPPPAGQIATVDVTGDSEPTFSSTSEDPVERQLSNSMRQLRQDLKSPKTGRPSLSSVFSTPGVGTPTPSFPRQRARFNLPAPETPRVKEESQEEEEETEREDEEDASPEQQTTPRSRRKSFLLSVINSTTRPRPRLSKAPTPHPRNYVPPSPGTTTLGVGETPAFSRVVNLQSAFVGVTPRPAKVVGGGVRRSSLPSHPLAQTFTPSDGDEHPIWATPGGPSPGYESDRASFISTASSHDLTTHARVNTSFDPAMGFAGTNGGGGVGRFNASKLNAYLHGLNRRLQEENEVLTARVIELEEGSPAQSRRTSRRISAGGTPLDNVDEGGLAEEKAELEALVEQLKADLEASDAARAEIDDALTRERKEKDRWKERMGDVERGVQEIVGDLEKKLRDTERKVERLSRERDEAVARAERSAEGDERVGQVLGDLRNANAQVQELEDEIVQSDEKVNELEKEMEGKKKLIANLEKKVEQLEQALLESEEELRLTKEFASELQENAQDAAQNLQALQTQVEEANDVAGKEKAANQLATQRIETLEVEMHRSQQVLRQTEEALDQVEAQMREDQDEVAQLKGTVRALEKEKQRLVDRSTRQDIRDDSRSPLSTILAPTSPEIQALETELDDAHKEIGRLQALLIQSPARRALDSAKDAKIDELERQRDDLLERNRVLKSTAQELNSPSRIPVNQSGISPLHRRAVSMSFRTPRTPGPPIPEMSWLNTTGIDPTTSHLHAKISQLQRDLDIANEQIDDRVDRLNDAGITNVVLIQKLDDARSKVTALEEELARLARTESRRHHQLQRMRCQKCRMKIDADKLFGDDSRSFDMSVSHLPLEPPTPPTRTSEALRADLTNVNAQLARMRREWDAEKKQLLGEKNALQDAANRLNSQLTSGLKNSAEKENAANRAKSGLQGELDTANAVIVDLESQLKTERSRLRALSSEQRQIQREKETILNQLQRTESDMDDVRQHLAKFKQENRELESELRVNSNAEQRARILEARVAENLETIEQLRHERSLLSVDHKELQKRFSDLSEHAKDVQIRHSTSQVAHDHRRNELDLQLQELADLRQALSTRNTELQRAESENHRIANEKSDVARTVLALQADLRSVRQQAESLGRDLKRQKDEGKKVESRYKEDVKKLDRAKKQIQSELRVVTEQLETQRQRTMDAREELSSHVCEVDPDALVKLKAQHSLECKGLLVHIRYLKARCTRESSFREQLVYQKTYLLTLLARFERSEKTIFAALARIGGFDEDIDEPRKPRPTLKSVALMVVFATRVQNLSLWWQEQSAQKQQVVAALHDVRRRRIAKN